MTTATALVEARPGRPSNSLHFVVGEMSGKLDQVLQAVLLDRARVEALDTRVTAIEGWRWQVMGGGAVVVFLVGAWEFVRYVNG